MCGGALNTLRSIYAKTTELQITENLAPMERSQIKYSDDCRNCETVMYPMSIEEGTLTGSCRQKSIC